jgi:transcriptional regulator with XRE-family HTH domain
MRSKVLERILKETPKEVKIFIDLYTDLVVRVNQILGEKGISKKELAQRLEKNPSEISKWLNGEHNFTLRSIAKLQAELGEPLLVVPKRMPHGAFVEGCTSHVHTFVAHRKLGNIPDCKIVNLSPSTHHQVNQEFSYATFS